MVRTLSVRIGSPRKSGFNSVQNVVELGSTIPIVYAKRETIGGNQYGGIRVNTNLCWSQLMSVGGSQFFRGIFLVSEASDDRQHPTIEYEQTALGNNTLGGFDLTRNLDAGRMSLYYAPGTGRIEGSDLEAGVRASNDIGNKENSGGADVYTVEGVGNTLGSHFCQALQPSNQITFGVYNLIGNQFGYKIGEDFRPLSHWQQRSDPTKERQINNQSWADREKQTIMFSTRAGVTNIRRNGTWLNQTGLVDLHVDDEVRYQIFRSSEADRTFVQTEGGSGQEDGEVGNEDTAATIASIQRGYDEMINIGEMYRIGSALAICTSRQDPFISDVDFDGDGQNMDAIFRIIENGQKGSASPVRGRVHVWSQSDLRPSESTYSIGTMLATNSSHLFRVSIASVALERAARVIEIGFRSRLRD